MNTALNTHLIEQAREFDREANPIAAHYERALQYILDLRVLMDRTSYENAFHVAVAALRFEPLPGVLTLHEQAESRQFADLEKRMAAVAASDLGNGKRIAAFEK